MEAIWALLGVSIGAALVYFLMRSRVQSAAEAMSTGVRSRLESTEERLAERTSELEQARLEINQLEQELNTLRERLHQSELKYQDIATRLQSSEAHNKERIEELTNAREQLKKEFQLLANEIFETKGKTFTEQNQQALEHLLKPFREQLGDFRKRVEDVREQDKKDMGGLLKAIEQVQSMGVKLSEDATNLTKALKGDSKQQGDWGEMILERILSESGLVKGREYDTQSTVREEGGAALRPDVVVRLPESKCIVIDSKVSLTDYERYNSSDDDSRKETALKAHVASLKKHIRGLSDKSYENLPGDRQPEFVLMFVPIEPALLTAVRIEPDLFTDAFRMRVCLVSPSTLIMTLKIIENIWRTENQNKNAEEIARKAGQLYDKFVNFVGDLENVGKHLDKARAEYESSFNKLSTGKGNLVRRAEELKAMGAPAKKALPESVMDFPDDED
jgi:DNA recombination protein RmuC